MANYIYEVTLHPTREFTQVAYFCSENGDCNLEEVPADQVERLTELLNRRGRDGWEMVQLTFGKDGMIAFWKRDAEAD